MSFHVTGPRPWLAGLAVLVPLAITAPRPAAAQEPAAFPAPNSDEFDPQGRNSTVLGAGARALGMGGAFLARADDATAASWNPAGLSYLRRAEASFVFGRSSFDRKDFSIDEVDESSGTSPDFASVAYPIGLWGSSGTVQLSFQRAISLDYNRSIGRPTDRRVGSTREITSRGGFDNIALGMGVRLSPAVRVGFTVNRWTNGYELHSDRVREDANAPASQTRVVQDASFKIRGGTSVNVGVIVSPIASLNLGVVAKSPFTSRISLARSRQDYPDADPTTPFTSQRLAAEVHPFDRDAVRLDMPAEVGFGVSWRPIGPLTLATDFTRTFWSGSEIRNYYVLRRTAEEDVYYGKTNALYPALPVALPFPNLDLARPLTALQRDSWQLRFGAEYVVIGERRRYPIRVGFFKDRQNFPAATSVAIEDPRSEPAIFTGITFGLGVVSGGVLVDVAHIYEYGEFELNRGFARTRSHRTLVSVIYRFGAPR